MKQLIKAILVNVFMIGALASNVVYASPLDDARNAGHIVEQANGYVQATASAPAQAKALAVQVNKRRKEAYGRIAKKNGISIEQVGIESYKQRTGS